MRPLNDVEYNSGKVHNLDATNAGVTHRDEHSLHSRIDYGHSIGGGCTLMKISHDQKGGSGGGNAENGERPVLVRTRIDHLWPTL